MGASRPASGGTVPFAIRRQQGLRVGRPLIAGKEGEYLIVGHVSDLPEQAVLTALERFPGWRSRYRRLVVAALPLRPEPGRLRADEAARERAVRAALLEPGSVAQLPPGRRPVYLWLHPDPPLIGGSIRSGEGGESTAEGES